MCCTKVTILASVKILRYWTVWSCARILIQSRLCVYRARCRVRLSLRLPDDGLVKPKHVGTFIMNFNVNFNIVKQFNFALVGRMKDLITSRCTVQSLAGGGGGGKKTCMKFGFYGHTAVTNWDLKFDFPVYMFLKFFVQANYGLFVKRKHIGVGQ
jgi:hypothetical protein